MSEKIYRLTGIDSAVEMLRPGAKWEITITIFQDGMMTDHNLVWKKLKSTKTS